MKSSKFYTRHMEIQYSYSVRDHHLTNHFDNCDKVDITETQHRLQDLMNLECAKITVIFLF